MPLWVGISWKASGLGASEQTKVRGNYICCLVIVAIFVGPGGAKRQVFFKVIIRRDGEKPQTRGTFMGRHKKLPKELTTELLYLELPAISASCGVKSYMHYIRFLLTKTSSAKFESIFPLGSISIYIHLGSIFYFHFFCQSGNNNWMINTAVIKFSLRYSLHIPHSNQTPLFFPV